MTGSRRFSRRSARVVRPAPAKAALGGRILTAIDEAVEHRWGAALQRAAGAEATTVERQVEALTVGVRRELGAAGAAAGGTSAVPGVGIATTSAAFAVELVWSTVRLTDLVLTIAAIHGHTDATLDERRMWVLSILVHGDGATSIVTRMASEVGQGAGTARVPAEAVRQLNKALATAVVTRYGTRRGVLAVGRAVPFGIGAALGYGLNSYVVKATARHAHAFFAALPPREGTIRTTAT